MYLECLINLLKISVVAGRPVSVAGSHSANEVPKPTCYRVMQAPLDEGIFEDAKGDGTDTIRDRLIRIALPGKSDIDIQRVAGPLFKAAATKFNETVFLGWFRDRKVKTVQMETPDDPGRALIHPGRGERPLHAFSCSKAGAAFADEQFVETIMSGTLQSCIGQTKVTRQKITAEFEQTRKVGFADCDHGIDVGISSVPAPNITGNTGSTFSAGAIGPVRRFRTEYRQQIGQKLLEFAAEVSGANQYAMWLRFEETSTMQKNAPLGGGDKLREE